MKGKYLSNSPAQTKKIARLFAREILKKGPQKRAVVLGLRGELGGGKTTFLQGLARELRIKEKITSPTFVLMRRFQIKGTSFENFYHLDCYRLEGPKEVLALGFKEIVFDPKNIVAVEWSEKIESILPKDRIIIFLSTGQRTREIVIK